MRKSKMLASIFTLILGALCAAIAIALLMARSPSFANEFKRIVDALKPENVQPNDKEE